MCRSTADKTHHSHKSTANNNATTPLKVNQQKTAAIGTNTNAKAQHLAHVKRRANYACMFWYRQQQQQQQQSSSVSGVGVARTYLQNCWHCRRLCHYLTLLAFGLLMWAHCIGGAYAAPQSCILCDKDDLKTKDPSDPVFEEYLFEHQVTRQDAINALRSLNDSFYAGSSRQSSCKSITCTNKVMKYCLGPQFINDHCWCELGHAEEGLPFVPHICYVGEKEYKASVGSCFFYEEVKECCCAPALAKQWRHISGATQATAQHNSFSLIIAALLFSLVAGHNLRDHFWSVAQM